MKPSQKGVSIVEAIVSMAVLSLVAVFGYSTVVNLQNQLHSTQSRLKARSDVAAMIESIAENTGSYVQVFQKLDTNQRGIYLSYDRAKIHYNNQGIYTKEDCPDCIGRISYLIEPHENIPAFSKVWIRVYSHKDQYKAYTFITGNL